MTHKAMGVGLRSTPVARKRSPMAGRRHGRPTSLVPVTVLLPPGAIEWLQQRARDMRSSKSNAARAIIMDRYDAERNRPGTAPPATNGQEA